MLSTVKKVGPVLDLFTRERPEWRMTEIARALEMPKSSAHSLVATLADIGLLSVGANGRYRLGWGVLELSERMRAGHDFGRHAGPVIQELSASARETVMIAALDRREVVYVERVEGAHSMVRLAGIRVGSRAPAHCTAVGKAILAHRDRAEVRALLGDGELRRFTAATITSPEQLDAQLDDVRASGVAENDREIHAEIACLAAPIRDQYGFVVAAVSVSMPAYRFDHQRTRLVDPLKRAASEISAKLAAAASEESLSAPDPLMARSGA